MNEDANNLKDADLENLMVPLNDMGARAAGFRDGLYNSTPICLLNLDRPEIALNPNLVQNSNYSVGETIGAVFGIAADVVVAAGIAEVMLNALQYV